MPKEPVAARPAAIHSERDATAMRMIGRIDRRSDPTGPLRCG